MLIPGRSSEYLFDRTKSKYSEFATSGWEIMKHVRPEAQDGRAGWIDLPDMGSLLGSSKRG